VRRHLEDSIVKNAKLGRLLARRSDPVPKS